MKTPKQGAYSHGKSSRTFTPEEPVEPFMTTRTLKKENIHDKSVRKMSELMKAIVL
jgi:hypothetical protein